MSELVHITRRIMIFSLIGICCFICNSCTIKASRFSLGYSATGASTPAGAKTFSVQHIENQADNVEAGFSQQVTDALKDYIQNNTGLILVTGKGDVDFEGSITGFSIRPVSIESGDVASKNRLTITIAVTYTCDMAPESNFNSSFSRYEDYSSNSDFESVKADLSEKILKLLVEDIFNKAFVNW
jgi:hypothetical protein